MKNKREAVEGKVIRFGAFEVNLDSGELRKHGLKIKLSKQAFGVLATFLAAPGRVVTRQELRRKIWPEETHVSFETNLNSIIHALREALGDSAKNPHFIDTVPGYGYRFVGPVLAPGHGRRRRLRRVPAYVAVALVIGLAGWGVYQSSRPRGRSSQSIPRLTPFTSYVGAEERPSFSPDGTRIAFHWNGEERASFDIYVKRIGSEDVERLTSNPADERSPAWSPNGVHIAFLRKLPGYQAAIVLISALTKEERPVATIEVTESTLSWSPDGRWIAYSVAFPDYLRRPSAERGILAVAIDTGQKVRITTPGSLVLGDLFPAFSPDGRKLAFIRNTSLSAGDLYMADLGSDLNLTGELRRLTFDDTDTRSPVWTPDGEEIIFVSGRAGYNSLWKVPVRGPAGSPPVALGGQNAKDPAIAPGGDRVVYASLHAVSNLWKTELRGPDRKPGPLERLTYSTKYESNPSFSPDGSRIAFSSDRSGNLEIWIRDSDSSNPRQVTSFKGPQSGTPRWSPDGKFLVLDSRVRGQGEIFVLCADGGTPRQLTTHPADDIVPSWSRDGKWIYFASNRTGDFQVWKMPSEGGTAIPVTKHGGFHAIESRGGDFLYYAKSAMETSLWKVPVEGGEETLVAESLSYWQNFSLSRDGIYFTTDPLGGRTPIKFLDFRSHETRSVATIDAALEGGLAVTRDGRTLVFSKLESDESDLILMELAR